MTVRVCPLPGRSRSLAPPSVPPLCLPAALLAPREDPARSHLGVPASSTGDTRHAG